MKKEQLRILIADDNKDFCDCLVNCIEKQEDMTVIATAADVRTIKDQLCLR